MGKKDEPKPQKSKLTFMLIQLEGGDDALEQSLRTISLALGGTVQPLRLLPSKNVEPTAPLIQSEEEVENGSQSNPPVLLDEQEPSTTNRNRSKTAPKSPAILDLNLNRGNPPLKEFLAPKNPGDQDSSRYSAIAYWYKTCFSTAEVTVNHIHTAYRHMSCQTPRNAGVTLRNLKYRNFGSNN